MWPKKNAKVQAKCPRLRLDNSLSVKLYKDILCVRDVGPKPQQLHDLSPCGIVVAAMLAAVGTD